MSSEVLYLQRVVLHFGTQYKGFFGINFFVYPFRTKTDMDDESFDESNSDFDRNPPYPSYHFDQFLQRLSENNQALEHREEVLQWASDIPPGNPDERT